MSSVTVENYLKAIYQLQDAGPDAAGPAPGAPPAVSTSALATRLGVAPASVTNMIQRLSQVDLVVYTPYQGVRLTAPGAQLALRVIRRHRLLELYLADKLGLPWDQVHAEAEQLEHHISPTLEEHIAAALGNPQVDPHGHPIPSASGAMPHLAGGPLAALPPGQAAVILRVADDDPALLRYLAARGMYPGAGVVVTEQEPFAGPLHVRIGAPGPTQEYTVSLPAAGRVWVAPRAEPRPARAGSGPGACAAARPGGVVRMTRAVVHG